MDRRAVDVVEYYTMLVVVLMMMVMLVPVLFYANGAIAFAAGLL